MKGVKVVICLLFVVIIISCKKPSPIEIDAQIMVKLYCEFKDVSNDHEIAFLKSNDVRMDELDKKMKLIIREEKALLKSLRAKYTNQDYALKFSKAVFEG